MKLILVTAGTFFLILGTIGIFLPVIPTVPLYLLAAGCYFRGDERIYRKVMDNPVFGTTVRNYRENRAMTKKAKAISVTTTILTIAFSICLVDILWVRIMLACIALGVVIHLLSMKTC